MSIDKTDSKGRFEVRKNEYYDVYYDEENKRHVKKAKRLRQKYEAMGYSLQAEDVAHDGLVCDQYVRTKFISKP